MKENEKEGERDKTAKLGQGLSSAIITELPTPQAGRSIRHGI